MSQPSSATSTADRPHAAASRKAATHLLPLLCLAYFMAFVDRTNVGLVSGSVGLGALGVTATVPSTERS